MALLSCFFWLSRLVRGVDADLFFSCDAFRVWSCMLSYHLDLKMSSKSENGFCFLELWLRELCVSVCLVQY